ncbi:hypothetical protein [Bacteroides sp. 51]|uniref:hypothetical protein n=1 Tax=Bacteroides sp. 51 TaxID=2302938 RepID=UPI0013D16AC1|nr:hypothetical protein [Bacteroides sp. 51]NDV82509.1 hypothetical protein [Bacteroides sp. 51]
MKMRNLCVAFALFVFTGLISSCSDDDDAPITLSYHLSRDTPFNNEYGLLFHSFFGGDVLLDIHGGDGAYTIQNLNNNIVTAVLYNGNVIELDPKMIGTANILIQDSSQKGYLLKVHIEYETQTYRVLAHEVYIKGESLTVEDKKKLEEDMLKRIPITEGGMYIFEYTDKNKTEGTVDLYSSAPDVPKVPFKIEKKPGNKPEYRYLETVTINAGEEEYMYDFGVYNGMPHTRDTGPARPGMFVEDVTDLFKEKYPAMEKAYTIQVLSIGY